MRPAQGVDDPQTEADRRAQRCIVGHLQRQFPRLRIIGEEDAYLDAANGPAQPSDAVRYLFLFVFFSCKNPTNTHPFPFGLAKTLLPNPTIALIRNKGSCRTIRTWKIASKSSQINRNGGHAVGCKPL